MTETEEDDCDNYDVEELGEAEGKTDTRARAWFITINNYSAEELNKAKKIKCVYTCVAEEIAPKTGMPHFHAWLYFKSAKFFSVMKRQFPRADIRMSKADYGVKARNYVLGRVKKKGNKDNPTFEESGEMPEQGKRNDCSACKDKVLSGGNMRAVMMEATSVQGVRIAEMMFKYHERKRDFKPTVKWYYGPTGCGKSHWAHAEMDDPFDAHTSIKWWEGYDAHENVVIDDMRGDFCKFHELLKLLDKYPFLIECKGGSRQFLAKNITITSCLHPSAMFDTREDLQQLLRRIDEIQYFEHPFKDYGPKKEDDTY